MSTLAPPPTSGTIQPENYRYLQELVYSGSGIVLEHHKHNLLEARLESVDCNRGRQDADTILPLDDTARGIMARISGFVSSNRARSSAAATALGERTKEVTCPR